MITKAFKRPYRWKTDRWLQKRKEVAEKLSYDVPRHKDPKGAAIAFIELLRIDREMRIREIQDTEMLGQQLENPHLGGYAAKKQIPIINSCFGLMRAKKTNSIT